MAASGRYHPTSAVAHGRPATPRRSPDGRRWPRAPSRRSPDGRRGPVRLPPFTRRAPWPTAAWRRRAPSPEIATSASPRASRLTSSPPTTLRTSPSAAGRGRVGGVGGPRAHGRPRVDLAEPRHELRHAQALVAAEEVPHRRLVAPPVAVLAHDL